MEEEVQLAVLPVPLPQVVVWEGILMHNWGGT